MAKVLKVGNVEEQIPETWKAVVTCKKQYKDDNDGCGAEVEIKFEDLFLMYWEGTNHKHYYHAWTCPACGKKNRYKALPKKVEHALYTKKNEKKAIFDGFSESL